MQPKPPDFRGTVQFLPVESGGRKGPTFQGYRPDLAYKVGPFELFMIWPRFLDSSLNEIADGAPVSNPALANFIIVNRELRTTVHSRRIKPGTEFWMCEGNRKVAEVVVKELLGDFLFAANQLPDPTLASGTLPAERESRLR